MGATLEESGLKREREESIFESAAWGNRFGKELMRSWPWINRYLSAREAGVLILRRVPGYDEQHPRAGTKQHITLPARAMTAGSWHLTGRAQTLAMALARHCTIPFVPLSAWESPAFKLKPNEKFFPSLFHYLLALVSLRTGAEEPGEPEAESTSTSCGLYLVSRLQHNEFVLRATLNPVPMQNWLHVEKSSAK
ncbi:hypothetical protein B0H13DRAFT_2281152 [Mycena leptocephala]|nr:hypothetical protein B0H13DRAFT_2281152 [Mycena leptocephala]